MHYIGNKLGSLPTRTIAAPTYNVLITDADTMLLGNAFVGTLTTNLPLLSAVPVGFTVHFKKIDTSSNAVVLTRAGADTIMGLTTVSLGSQYDGITLVAGPSSWISTSISNSGSIPTASGEYALNTVASSGVSQLINFATYKFHDITLDANCSLTYTLPTVPAGKANEYVVILRQNGVGGFVTTFSSNGTITIWSGTTSPSTPAALNTNANAITILRFKQVAGATSVITTVEGQNTGSNSGYAPVVANYVIVGNAEQADKSSDGITFTASDPVFPGTPDINDVIYTGANFILVANISDTTQGNTKYSSNNGATWTTVGSTGSAHLITKFLKFSNGNVIAQANAAGGGIPLTTDSGVTFSDTQVWSNASANTPIYGINGNSAIAVSSGDSNFSTTIDAGVTWASIQSHSPAQNATAAAILNNYILYGGSGGQIMFKTLANLTSTSVTGASSNLNASPVLGFAQAVDKLLGWTGTAINTVPMAGSPSAWTDRSTAFFTTAGMTGNITGLTYNGSSRVVAVTDTGNIGYSDDSGVTWTKVTIPNNPHTGFAIRGIRYFGGTFFTFGDNGLLSASTLGQVFSSITNTFGGLSINGFAAS